MYSNVTFECNCCALYCGFVIAVLHEIIITNSTIAQEQSILSVICTRHPAQQNSWLFYEVIVQKDLYFS